MLNIRYYIDPVTDEFHIYEHGVYEDEIEDVLNRPIEDYAGRNDSRVAIGQTLGGRYLRVIYVPDEVPNSVFVVTAYELSGKALTAFRRRQRKRR